jgi:hypothetical protein
VTQVLELITNICPLSLLLDIDYFLPENTANIHLYDFNATPTSSQATDLFGLPWIQHMSDHAKMEIGIDNPFDGKLQPGELTQRFVSQLESAERSSDCVYFSEIVNGFRGRRRTASNGAQFLYFSTNGSSSGFCFSSPLLEARTLEMKVRSLPSSYPYMVKKEFTLRVPARLGFGWTEVVVDGVLIRHRFQASQTEAEQQITEEVPLSPAAHLVEIRIGVGTKLLVEGRAKVGPFPDAYSSSSSSTKLRAEITTPESSTFTTPDGLTTIRFVVENKGGNSSYYEVRNNGELLFAGIAFPQNRRRKGIELARRIPIRVGTNNVVVEVRDGGSVASAATSITRRSMQSVRAVIAGVGRVEGAPELPGVVSDVNAMRDLILRYTDVEPDFLTVVAGPQATVSAIRDALRPSAAIDPTDPFLQGVGTSTLFFYFAGYGTTVLDTHGEPQQRCMVATDFTPTSKDKGCLSVEDLTALLELWDRTIAILDTSFDGLSGIVHPDEASPHRNYSRTLSDYYTVDERWQAAISAGRPDRIVMFANEQNRSALESVELPIGFFTRSFYEAVQEELRPSSGRVTEGLSLLDAFSLARNKTFEVSGKEQTPVKEGALSSPFLFTARSPVDLNRTGNSAETDIRADFEALRRPNTNEIYRADVLFGLVRELEPTNVEALQGMAQTSLYAGRLSFAESLIAAGLTTNESSSKTDQARARWLTLRADLKMQKGDIDGSLADCEAAGLLVPNSERIQALCAGLNLAKGNSDKSGIILGQLLQEMSKTNSRELSDDQWGHIVLLKYIADRQRGSRTAMFDLKNEFNRATRAELLHAPWFRLAAEYLLDPTLHFSLFRTYADENEYDEQAFSCILHFYAGMKFIFGGSRAAAKREFAMSVESNQTQYVEYWIAKQELNRFTEGK